MIAYVRHHFTSFACLNLTQFFSALNDNVYKLLLVFFLITIKGPEHSNTILSLAGAIFVIPFILFASLAGTIADRYSKRSIVYWTRLTEIVTMSFGVLAFALKSAIAGYAILFLMAVQSTLFSPVKYGILPEIVKKEKISRCNGIMTATTYLAIIVGTFLASFLAQITNKNFVLSGFFCVYIVVMGAISCLGIQKTKPQAAEKKVSARFISVVIQTLKRARRQRYLLTTIICGAYFLFIGAYTQLNIIPFAMQSLKLSEVQGGYLFLMTAIGIGIGSFLAGRLAGKEIELGFVPLAAFGVMVTLLFLYFFEHFFHVVVPLLILLGAFGGFYVVPVDAFIQVASPPEDRGQNVAAANFLSFIGVIIASFLIAFLGNFLGLTAAQGFLVVALLTLVIAILLLLVMADQVLRLIVSIAARFFWNLRVTGRKNIRLTPPALLLAQRNSWLDTIVVMATLPRLIKYVVPIKGRFIRQRSLLYRLLRLIPVDIDHISPIGIKALGEIRNELTLGHSVCMMQPVGLPAEDLRAWEDKLYALLDELKVPIIPIHIERAFPEEHATYFEQLKTLFKNPIKVSYGMKVESH